MNYINKSEVEKLVNRHPFFYYPLILKLKYSTKEDYKELLNSIALRHPRRRFLKNFIENHNFNQSDIIENIINKNPKISKSRKNFNNKNLSENSLKNKEFISENLAKIYIQQNNVKGAIKIYKKLISLNSKKKSYFAKKIEKLR